METFGQSGVVYVDGSLSSPQAARISVFDRGFLYGDSVFETLRVYQGTPFAFAEHIKRFYASARRLGLVLPWTAAFLTAAVQQTLQATSLKDLYLRIIATRGVAALGLDPSSAQTPSLVIIAVGLPPLPDAMYSLGRSAALVGGGGVSAGRPTPSAKTGNYRHAVLASAEASRHGADEAILLDSEGRVTEASAANVFVRLGEVWCTPPLHVGILSGITRQTILQLCAQHDVAVAEREMYATDLQRASAIFLCASVREIVPIVRLDGAPVGDGKVGPHTGALMACYRQAVQASLSNTPA